VSRLRVEPTPELFRTAAQILRERGLYREKFIDPDGSGQVCMLGAVGIAAGLDDLDQAAYMVQVQEFLAAVLNGGRPSATPFIRVTEFNDRADDVEQVATFLEMAAEELV